MCMQVCVFIIVCAVSDRFMISSDDLGYGDLEVYPNPSPLGRISTPHLNGKLELHTAIYENIYNGHFLCSCSFG